MFLVEYKRASFYAMDVAVRAFLIVLRVLMPYAVFKILVGMDQISQAEANSFLWAVLAGQILYGSMMRLHEKIRDDIRTGDIAIRLSEPVNYVFAKVAQAFGYFLPRFVLYALPFFTFFYFFVPAEIDVPILFFFTIVSFLIYTSVHVILGLTSFVVEQNEGIYWLVSKFFLLFGNQIIPVALMPAAVFNFAKVTPFYLGLSGPVEAASGRIDPRLALLLSILYICVFLGLAFFMLSRLKRKIVMNG